jgi:hypothetical protein
MVVDDSCASPSPHGKYGAQPCVAKPQPTPGEHAEIDAEEHVAEQRRAYAHVAGDRAAEEAGEQHRAEKRGARDQIEGEKARLQHADREPRPCRVAELHEEHEERRHGAAGPKPGFRRARRVGG